MSTLTVESVSKYYGDVTAVKDVTFEIEDEFAVLLGESGAGKSTMLRCINGLTEPSEGQIRLDGEPVNSSRADVGMIFQQHNLVEGVSAYVNALTGSLDRTSVVKSIFQWQNREEKIETLQALKTVGLLEEAHQKVSQMSGGQQQRVGIARALVQNPQLLVADEPVASLDPSSAETVMAYLKKAATQRDVTTLVSLHQVNIAAYFGERFIGLRDGRILFDVTRDELTPDLIDDLYGDVETVGLSDNRQGDDDLQPEAIGDVSEEGRRIEQ